MSPLFVLLCLVLLGAQFALPRRYAFVPLLIGVCHFQDVPVIQVGVSFSSCKLVILAGLIRATYERRIVLSSRQPLDRLVVAWMCWAIFSGFFHSARDYNPMTIRLSLVYDGFGAYLYGRSYLRSQSDFLRFTKCLALVVIPLAALVLLEKNTLQNVYGAIAGGMQEVEVRGGRVRAMGPFLHSILAGTFGATAMLLLVPLRSSNPRLAAAGAAACGIIVFSSASSGPILTLFSGLAALVLWRFRTNLPWIRRSILLGIVGLHIVMQAPVWYLLARIDLVGGSTGWHRAELITSALKYIEDWWLIGTDYTRHWIPYGVDWSGDHTDLTNDYLYMGVSGGLPMMLLFIAVLMKAFQLLGRGIHELRQANDRAEFVLWCVGSSLFAHCVTFFSISYFDQSRIAFWMLIGAVPGLCAATFNRRVAAASEVTNGTGGLDERSIGEPVGNVDGGRVGSSL
jgi:hypothetical protein